MFLGSHGAPKYDAAADRLGRTIAERHAKPVGFLEVDGFWAPRRRRRDLLVVEDDPAALLDRLAAMRTSSAGVITPEER